MKLRSLAALALATIPLNAPVAADDPIACVDPDIAATLILNLGGESSYFEQGWPAAFPELPLPDSLELIGSRTSQFAMTAGLKSPTEMEDVRAALAKKLRSAGWYSLNDEPRPDGGGFIQRMPPSMTTSLVMCHDTFGTLTARFAPAPGGGTYATLYTPVNRRQNDCLATRHSAAMERGAPTLPLLYVPDDADVSYVGGAGSSSGQANTGIAIKTKRSAASLLESFTGQLVDQDWRQLGQWAGDGYAGSAWSTDDETTSGLLTITALGDNIYSLNFSASLRRSAR